MNKKPTGLILSFFRFILWGWMPVLAAFMWTRSLDHKARKMLISNDCNQRGMGRSIVMFMCEMIYWEISYLHKRGGWLANRQLELIEFAFNSAQTNNDVDRKSIEDWKNRCRETIGFVGPNRVFVPQKSRKAKIDKISPRKTAIVYDKHEPIVIHENIMT